jgi:hypothetical protein
MDYSTNNLGVRPTTYRQISLKIVGVALPRRVGQLPDLGIILRQLAYFKGGIF